MIKNPIIRTLLAVAGFLLVAALLWYVRTIIAYILIAVVLTLLGSPLMKLFARIRVGKFQFPNALNAVLTLVVMLLLLGGFVSLFAPLVAEEARLISSIDVEQVFKNLEGPIAELQAWIDQYSLSSNPDEQNSKALLAKLSSVIDVTKVSNVFGSLIGVLGNLFIALFSILFITFFLLKDRDIIPKTVAAFTPDKYMEQVKSVLENAKKTLTRYFIGILIQVSIVTILISIGLSLIGVENALVIGFFAGIINVVPYLGPLIGAGFGIVIALSTNLDLDFYSEMMPLAAKIAAIFLVVQLLDNFLFQPFIFSNSVNIHPLEVFLVVLMAGTLAGVSGMILAIPAYSFLRIIAKEFLSEFKIVKSLTGNMES